MVDRSGPELEQWTQQSVGRLSRNLGEAGSLSLGCVGRSPRPGSQAGRHVSGRVPPGGKISVPSGNHRRQLDTHIVGPGSPS